LLESDLSKPTPKYSAPLGHVFSIILAQRQEDWAIFSANMREHQNTVIISADPLFFIAHRLDTVWSIWLPNSPQFCNQLINNVPDTLLAPVDKSYYCQ